MERIHNEFNHLFSGIKCFEGMLSLQVKEGSCLYEALPIKVNYTLQKHLIEELQQLLKQHIIVLLDVDKMSESVQQFHLVPKAN